MGQLIVQATAFLLIVCSSCITIRLFRKMIVGVFTQIFWLISASFVLSVGVWSMHFVALTAHPFRSHVMYQLGTVFLSLIILIFMSFLSLLLLLYGVKWSRTHLLILGSIVMGIGINLMHFIGMKAVIVQADMEYRLVSSTVSSLLLVLAIAYIFQGKRVQQEGIIPKMASVLLLSTAIFSFHLLSVPILHFNSIHTIDNHDDENYNNLIMFLAIITVVAVNFMYSIIILLIDRRLKLSEDQLRQVNKMYSLILNSVAEGILRLDENQQIVFWNSAAEHMTGFLASEVIGKSFDLQVMSYEAGHNPVEQAIAEGTVRFVPEELFFKKDGRTFQAKYHVTPMYNEQFFIGAVINFTDISERKKNESIMRETEKLSLAGQLAAGIAHEIRNPLTTIKGFIQLLQKGMQKPDYIPIMTSEINRMELIISELLTLSKPHLYHVKQVDLCELLDHVLTLVESQALMNNVQIETQYAEPFLFINCDANQIKQVFINLIKNAIEAAHGGMIRIQMDRDENRVVTSIIDNGPGIPEDVLALIGKPFFTTKEKGTGLGLMISNKILSSHEGLMQIESKANVGTTFKVILPVASPALSLELISEGKEKGIGY